MKHAFGLVLALAVGACSGESTLPNVGPGIGDRHGNVILAQAEFEMNCPRDQIQLTKVTGGRVSALGCGRRGLYMRTVSGWILSGGCDSVASGAVTPVAP